VHSGCVTCFPSSELLFSLRLQACYLRRGGGSLDARNVTSLVSCSVAIPARTEEGTSLQSFVVLVRERRGVTFENLDQDLPYLAQRKE
jgi:hypothetical protein